MNNHAMNATVGKAQIKVKLMANAVQTKDFSTALQQATRTIELLEQLQKAFKENL